MNPCLIFLSLFWTIAHHVNGTLQALEEKLGLCKMNPTCNS